ncbi:MAG: hypothetical protein EOO61_04315, partial [Hymenobacter sp.]
MTKQLRDELTQYDKYRVIPDANQYAQQVRAAADTDTQAQLARARQETETLRAAADTDVQS